MTPPTGSFNAGFVAGLTNGLDRAALRESARRIAAEARAAVVIVSQGQLEAPARRKVGFQPDGATRWHVLTPDARATLCGMQLADRMGQGMPARAVPEVDRCRAPGCRAGWPPNLHSV